MTALVLLIVRAFVSLSLAYLGGVNGDQWTQKHRRRLRLVAGFKRVLEEDRTLRGA